MPLIAGSADLDAAMERLGAARPAFHSEADFQPSFGQVVHELDLQLSIQLESGRPR